MDLSRLSLKGFISGVFLMLGTMSVVLSVLAGTLFREAALRSQTATLQRVVEVAVGHVRSDLERGATELATLIGRDDRLLSLLREGDRDGLASLLDEPFLKGTMAGRDVSLFKLRLYDLDYRLVAESRRGTSVLPRGLPPELEVRARGREGIERLKSLSGFFPFIEGAAFHRLAVVGGLQPEGYLDVALDPVGNFRAVADDLRISLSIRDLAGREQARFGGGRPGDTLPVGYLLHSEGGAPLLRLVAFEDVTDFNTEIGAAQHWITTGFLVVSIGFLLLALVVFRRFLLTPLDRLVAAMNAGDKGLEMVPRKRNCLKEIRVLGDAFETMAAKVRLAIDELRALSATDPLTGIANRRLFDQLVEHQWLRLRRNGGELALVVADIDFFKRYNDTYGHAEGDFCIKAVAEVIKQAARRPDDLAARYGGEEFVLLLPETDLKGVVRLAGEISAGVAALDIPHAGSDVAPRVTLSMGLAVLRPQEAGGEPSLIFEAADKALYRAKQGGRNRYEMADDGDWNVVALRREPSERSRPPAA